MMRGGGEGGEGVERRGGIQLRVDAGGEGMGGGRRVVELYKVVGGGRGGLASEGA